MKLIRLLASSELIPSLISSRQVIEFILLWQVIDDEPELAPHLQKLAEHHKNANQLKLAEKFYVRAKLYTEAIAMYNNAGK